MDAVVESGWECFQEEVPPAAADAVVELLDGSTSTVSASCLEEAVPASMEELLDEGDRFLQEFRWSSAALINCVCQPDAIRIIVEHVVREPREDDEVVPLERARRRSHTAAELLASCSLEGNPMEDGSENGSTRLVQLFFANGDSELLDLLWGFLLDDAPADRERPSWNVLAGYFCSSAAALFSRRPEELVEYLRSKGPELVFEQFIRCLNPRCMAELFANLLCAELPQRLIFPIEGLILRLVDCLGNDAVPSCDADNIALCINTLLLSHASANRLCYASAVLEQISAPEVVERLVQRAVTVQQIDAAVAAASILSCAVASLHQLPAHPSLMYPGPDLLRGLPDEEAQAGATEEQVRELQTAASTLVQSLSPHLSQLSDFVFCQAPPLEVGDSSGELATLRHAVLLALQACKDDSVATSDLVNQLLPLSPRSRSLEAILSQDYICQEGAEQLDAMTQQIPTKERLLSDLRRARAHVHAETDPGVGFSHSRVTIEVLALLVQLARTREPLVLQHFLEAELLQRSVALLLRSTLSSALQNTVMALFSEVARCPSELAAETMLALLRDGVTMSSIFEALRRGPRIQQALEQSSESEACRDDMIRHNPQPNFNGHLRAMCVELHHLGSRVEEVHQALHSLDGWAELVLPELEAAEQLEQQPLGGLPQTMAAEFSQEAEGQQHVDFSPEDLRDIDEDFDTELLLNLAGEQQLHRQAQVQESLGKMGGGMNSASIGISPPDTEEC